MKRRIAGGGDLVDARSEVFADAGDVAQAGFVEERERVGWLAAMSAPWRYARI